MLPPGAPRPTVTFPNGREVPALGLGTWHLGEEAAKQAAEVAALRLALELGYRVFDTAEMYADGGAEAVLGEALAQAQRHGVTREQVFVCSKVLPQHADAAGVLAACDASRRRLRLDCIDLYLLHWRGGVPLAETVRGMEQLLSRGHIRMFGVSNFDLDDLHELAALPGGRACAANQVWYSLSERGAEHAVLPWQRARQMPLMAYCPLDQGALAGHVGLRRVAEARGVTPAQIALAWLLAQPGVMPIPKAGQAAHLQENLAAATLTLATAERQALDGLFPPPRRKRPLAMR